MCVCVRGAWVCGPVGAPLYVYPASVWVRQGCGWGEGRYFCPTASVSGGGEAPEEAASRSPAGPHPSSGVALRAWGRESPLFFGTGGQEMGLSPWGRWALPGVLRTVREGLSCFPFRRPLKMSGLGGRLWPLSLPMGSWLGSGSGLWAASACRAAAEGSGGGRGWDKERSGEDGVILPRRATGWGWGSRVLLRAFPPARPALGMRPP